jgi:hypothetical protein
MSTSLTLLTLALLSNPSTFQWSDVSLVGWSREGTSIAWHATVYSQEHTGDSSGGALEFLVVTDADGRTTRTFRLGRNSSSEWTWTDEAEDLWRKADPKEAGERWREEHLPAGLTVFQQPPEQGAVISGGAEPLVLSTYSDRTRCRTLTLVARLGSVSGSIAAPEAVQPLSWKSPYAITVAAGAR